MTRTPQAVWIVDTKKEHLAVDEARKLKIPVIGILDTNCDPDEVDFAIPGNDDAIRSVSLLTRVLADAVADGLMARSGGAQTGEESEVEPMPDWERELLGPKSRPRRRRPVSRPGLQTVAEEIEAVTAADAAPVPADEVPAVVAAEADDEALPHAGHRARPGPGRGPSRRRELTTPNTRTRKRQTYGQLHRC